jgi:hypothetical protein
MAVEWLLAMAALGAVPGTPEPVKPIAEIPDLAGRWYDDDLGYRPDHSHYRTWQLTGSLRIENVVLTLDHATLDGETIHERIDTLSASIGWTDERPDAWWCVGIGGRGRGEYGGATIQLRGHSLMKNGYTPTPYEDASEVGYGFLNGGWLRWTRPATAARLRAGIEATASGELISDGQLLSAFKLRAIGAAGPISGWVGMIENRHDGRDSASDAEQEVLEHEEGLCWIGGLSAWWLSYAMIWLPKAEIAGAISLEFEW